MGIAAARSVRAAPEYVSGFALPNTQSDRREDLRVGRRALRHQEKTRSTFREIGYRKQYEPDEEYRHNQQHHLTDD